MADFTVSISVAVLGRLRLSAVVRIATKSALLASVGASCEVNSSIFFRASWRARRVGIYEEFARSNALQGSPVSTALLWSPAACSGKRFAQDEVTHQTRGF